jgi:hypothetical protein
MERQARQCAEEQLVLVTHRLQQAEDSLVHLRKEVEEAQERFVSLKAQNEEQRSSFAHELEMLKAKLNEVGSVCKHALFPSLCCNF